MPGHCTDCRTVVQHILNTKFALPERASSGLEYEGSFLDFGVQL